MTTPALSKSFECDTPRPQIRYCYQSRQFIPETFDAITQRTEQRLSNNDARTQNRVTRIRPMLQKMKRVEEDHPGGSYPWLGKKNSSKVDNPAWACCLLSHACQCMMSCEVCMHAHCSEYITCMYTSILCHVCIQLYFHWTSWIFNGKKILAYKTSLTFIINDVCISINDVLKMNKNLVCRKAIFIPPVTKLGYI